MNPYLFYTKIYGYTRNYSGIPVWALTPFRRLIRKLAMERLPRYFAYNPADINRSKKKDVIVSLTSFPARIGFVYLTVESLLRQSILPEKILLWLSKVQFPTDNSVPERLRFLQNEVFQIRYVDGDIKSHKKYYYSLYEYPQKAFITVDDDIIYPPTLIENLLEFADSFPNCIIANSARQLTYTEGKLDNYKLWKQSPPYDKKDNVQIGYGGVLYPPNSLYADCLNLELSQILAPTVDDLWLNAMARLQGTCIVRTTYQKAFLPIVISDNQTLTSVNNGQSQNDIQLNQIRKYYASTGLGDPYKL